MVSMWYSSPGSSPRKRLAGARTSDPAAMMPAVTDGAGIDGDRGAAARVLAGLDDEQRAAVTAPAGPVCILAGAGTGKTRAITHRIAHRVLAGQVRPQHVLAVTFTARAAAEMRARLAGL